MNRIQKFKSRVVAFCVVSLFLHGCAFMPDNWPVDEEILSTAPTKVKRIALLDVPEPSKIWLGDPSSATAGFINPLISLAVTTHEGDSITRGAYISETAQKEMQNWLEHAGFEVTLLEAERTNKHKILEDYSQFEMLDVDAILEIGPISVGFREKMGEMHFTEGELSPDVAFVYRLITPGENQVLIESNVFYSSFRDQYQGAGFKRLGPREHIFEDVESVEKQPEEALRRIRYAIVGATEIISVKIQLFAN